MSRIAFSPPPQLWFATAFALLAIVVYLSLNHAPVQLPGDEGGRFGHMAAYGSLMFMFARMYAMPRGRLLIGALLVLIGITLECLQATTGYRTFEYADMIANTTGVVLGWLAQRTLSLITMNYVRK
ncbi:MAG TPA: VanZ family protein [Burkholderiales bacterium]|nr:VanZ family protein [Burkholderiales bacterium]